MDWFASEAVSVLAFLLPGLVAAAVFYSLTSYPKPNQFGHVVQALAFTVAAQAVTWILLTFVFAAWGADSWPAGAETAVSVLTAILLALIMAWALNHDVPHKLLRRIGVTKETSYPSEWYSAFHRYTECYVVLHLKDGRRLYGWPQEWPGHPEQGHFIMAEGEWLVENERIPLPGVSVILIPGQDVKMVEFLEQAPGETPEE